MLKKTDVIIVGAGLIGTSIALSLPRDFKIQILENHLSNILAPSPHNNRPISLSNGSYEILKKLGIWDALSSQACPILTVHVSEKGKLGSTRFTAAEQKVSALGFVVPFSALQSALYQKAADCNHIEIISIHQIEKIKCDISGAEIITAQKKFQSELLIAADGTQSSCRDLLSIDVDHHSCDDTAHIYQLTLSEDHDHTAYERFTRYGVLAILPLWEKKRAQLVWTITPAIEKKINGWDNTAIVNFLQDTFEGRIEITDAKKITQFHLQTRIAKKQVVESAVLLGNAAHTIYPVAAQGFNLGLQDVRTLSAILRDAKKNNRKLGDLSVLKKYEHKVSEHQKIIYSITSELIGLFDLPFLGSLRGLGLLATDLIKPIKNKLAKRAMGFK